MTQLLVLREHLIQIYQKHAKLLKILCRFLINVLVFLAINEEIGYNPALRPWYVVLGFVAIGLILPQQALLFLVAVYVIAHIYYVSIVLSLVTALIFIVLYFIYLRFVQEHGYIFLATPILYAFNIPYALPLVLGLTAEPITVIPMSCGVILYHYFQIMTNVIASSTSDNLNMYNQVVQQTFSDWEVLSVLVIFAAVMMLVYMIRKSRISYSFEIAILTGSIANIVLLLITNFIHDDTTNIGTLLVQTMFSALAAWCIQFFVLLLNYAGTEYLQFEDGEYYYYVKAVPKMSIATPNKSIKRFDPRLLNNSHSSEKENAERESEPLEDTEMLDKHDFDFKVSVDEEVFRDEEEKNPSKDE